MVAVITGREIRRRLYPIFILVTDLVENLLQILFRIDIRDIGSYCTLCAIVLVCTGICLSIEKLGSPPNKPKNGWNNK
jgi:hypothetical protein